MNKILNPNEAIDVAERIRKDHKTIVLAGGCFDILHRGHIFFLEEAGRQGDILILFLESDENIKSRKGLERPINSQKYRSIVLSALSSVDYVIPLEGMTNNQEYDKLIVQISPDIIALTEGDPGLEQRKKQAKIVGAKIRLIKKIEGRSTTNLIKNNG
ncbi:MAG: bifunctional heptose 7-phosphate kinase/heptose 1-phosphate adenyltransferase [uncultured bacterium]|nr:MAG: bifunctional heptose 7-phosphate kinase/heptose 1-phosphate adenyltransferase [uncultured bacterium]